MNTVPQTTAEVNTIPSRHCMDGELSLEFINLDDIRDERRRQVAADQPGPDDADYIDDRDTVEYLNDRAYAAVEGLRS